MTARNWAESPDGRLALLILLVTLWGGWPFRLVWILVAGLVAYEWLAIIGRGNAVPAGIGVVMTNTHYAEFTVATNGPGREKPPYAVTTTNLLKVTLRNSLGERATRFFTVPPL